MRRWRGKYEGHHLKGIGVLLGTSNILEGNEADVKNVNVGLESLGMGE